MSALETVKQYYECFNNKDYKGMLALVHDDIRHDSNQGETRHGKALFEEFVHRMDVAYDEQLKEMVFMSAPGTNRVAVEFMVDGKYKQADEGMPAAHGQSYWLPAGAFLEVKDDKVSRVTTYYNLPLWIDLVSK